MRWKDVFLIWLLADVLLAAGSLIAVLITGGVRNDLEIFPFVLLYGFLVTLPSLAAMLLFHAVYSHVKKNETYQVLPYLLLVLSINLIYWLVWIFTFRHYENFQTWLILCTTIAGLIALAIVHLRIKKREQQVIIENLSE
jgi:chromate transport protein ChrA